MGKPRRNRNQEEPAEAQGLPESVEEANAETFAEAQGLPANAHAKKIAKEKSKKDIEAAEAKAKLLADEKEGKKRPPTPAGIFYTRKGEHKIIKLSVKKDPIKVFSIYVGNIKKHKESLDPLIKHWKKEGVWLEPHEVDAKVDSYLGREPKEEPAEE